METASNALPELLTEKDVARITKRSVASVRRWRRLSQGPKFLRISSSIRYRPGDLKAFLESRPMGGGSTEAR